jgi:hypothetical protein
MLVPASVLEASKALKRCIPDPRLMWLIPSLGHPGGSVELSDADLQSGFPVQIKVARAS